MSARLMFALVVAALIAGSAATAGAELVLTRSQGSADASIRFFGAGLPDQSDSEEFGPFGGVAVAEVLAFGRTRAAQTGSGLNAVTALARPSDVLQFLSRADTNIVMEVSNTGPAVEDLHFEYLINGGELRLFGQNGSFDGLEATVAVSIFTPDFSELLLWEWGATLRGTGASVETIVHGFASIYPFHDPLGLGQPAISPVTVTGNEAVVSIAPFTGVAVLGDISPGGLSRIEYSMFARISGPGINETGAEATIGDPFDLTGDAGTVLSIRGVDLFVVVPEPTAIVLLLAIVASALTALTFHRRSAL